MDYQAELRGFLTTRRARITPEEAGMTPFTGVRRVPGMRREEVAYLAGISVDYYTRLERGKVAGISQDILDGVARALRLDDVEHEHLVSLVQALRSTKPARKPKRGTTSETSAVLQRVLDSMTVPAYIQNSRLDLVSANPLGWEVYPHAKQYLVSHPGKRFNTLRFQILDPRAQDFYIDWELATRNSVAVLREAAGHDCADSEMFSLIGELSAKSDYFRALWASHDVIKYRSGAKHYRHPVVGDISFDSQSFNVGGEAELRLVALTVAPNSAAADALAILATWTSDGSRAGASVDVDEAEHLR
jgi:transcriptional regulator with XRE-family HTH domain